MENRRAAMIFIKYMHDIVLKISFLDINSQNWNTGGHLKLWQEIVRIRHWCEQFQIFHLVVDGHVKTNFFLLTTFWALAFFSFDP